MYRFPLVQFVCAQYIVFIFGQLCPPKKLPQVPYGILLGVVCTSIFFRSHHNDGICTFGSNMMVGSKNKNKVMQ